MRILHFGELPTEVGGDFTTGVGNVVWALAKAESKIIDVAVYSYNINQKKAEEIKDFKTYGYSQNSIQWIFYAMNHPFFFIIYSVWCIYAGTNPIKRLNHIVNLRKVIKEFKPNIIHTHGIVQYTTAFFANEDKIPMLITFHGFFYPKVLKRLIDKSMQYVHYTTVLTKEIQEQIEAKFDGYEYWVVPNGTDTSKFYFSNEDRLQIRKEMNINDNTIVFITVASIQERKGQLKFIKYLQNSVFDNYKYLILGTGNQEQEIKEYITANNLEDKVLIKGYVSNSELYKYYSAADIYAHVSTAEGQSLAELEGEATGLRILVNNVLKGTLANDITGKENFFSTDLKGNDDTLFIEWIKKVPEYRVSVATYDWFKIAKEYQKVYQAIYNKN